MTTLKEQFELNALRKKLTRIGEQKIIEECTSNLIIEALDEKDLEAANQILNKLRMITGKGVDSLDKAVKQAASEINKFTGGGALSDIWSKIKSSVGIDNPIVKAMTFANTIETGFKQFPTILKNVSSEDLTDKANAEKSVNDVLGDDEQQKSTILTNVTKSFSPKGLFGAFKKVPYVDVNALSNQLMNSKLSTISQIVKIVSGGPQTDAIAQDMKELITGQGRAETKEATPSQPAKSGEGTSAATQTKSTSAAEKAAPEGQAPVSAATPGLDIPSLVQKLGPEIKKASGLKSDKNVEAIINALAKSGALKNP